MVIFGLITFIFVLIGVIGLQLMYSFYVERLDRERKRFLRDLERENRKLKEELNAARTRLTSLHLIAPDGSISDEDLWAEVIEEG